MIIVAHRLSTVKDADEILVLNKGSIVERGKHDELIRKTQKALKKIYATRAQHKWSCKLTRSTQLPSPRARNFLTQGRRCQRARSKVHAAPQAITHPRGSASDDSQRCLCPAYKSAALSRRPPPTVDVPKPCCCEDPQKDNKQDQRK